MKRILERAMLDIADAAGGEDPIAIYMHAEWATGGGIGMMHAPPMAPKNSMLLCDRMIKQVQSYFNQVKIKMNTIKGNA